MRKRCGRASLRRSSKDLPLLDDDIRQKRRKGGARGDGGQVVAIDGPESDKGGILQ